METFSALLGPLWGESIGHQWIPLTKASGEEFWCFLWSVPKQMVEQTIETPSRSLWRHFNVLQNLKQPPYLSEENESVMYYVLLKKGQINYV